MMRVLNKIDIWHPSNNSLQNLELVIIAIGGYVPESSHAETSMASETTDTGSNLRWIHLFRLARVVTPT
jgi:hypothetical protein